MRKSKRCLRKMRTKSYKKGGGNEKGCKEIVDEAINFAIEIVVRKCAERAEPPLNIDEQVIVREIVTPIVEEEREWAINYCESLISRNLKNLRTVTHIADQIQFISFPTCKSAVCKRFPERHHKLYCGWEVDKPNAE